MAALLMAAACDPSIALIPHHPVRRARHHHHSRFLVPRRYPLRGIHRIRHVVMIMQENRSFDSYFGTYPGADGIPMRNGVPTVCSPDPSTGTCLRPFHDTNVVNAAGPHTSAAAIDDVDHGAMD